MTHLLEDHSGTVPGRVYVRAYNPAKGYTILYGCDCIHLEPMLDAKGNQVGQQEVYDLPLVPLKAGEAVGVYWPATVEAEGIPSGPFKAGELIVGCFVAPATGTRPAQEVETVAIVAAPWRWPWLSLLASRTRRRLWNAGRVFRRRPAF